MTVTIKQIKINGHYISIDQEKFSSGYKVSVYPMYTDDTCGYPIDSHIYDTKEKALRRFNTLVKRYK